MNFKQIQEIPTPQQLMEEIPISKDIQLVKSKRDQELRDIFTGKSDKFVLIIGPCSADNEDSVCDYVSRLGKVQEKVADKLLLIPRIYTNKPRTTGEGYKGMVHQPNPQGASNMLEGIKSIRKMHIRAIEESGLTAADEMLYPENHQYLDDILSYVAVGARSVENQQHRLAASGLDIPVGMKNATSGDIMVMLNAIRAAQIHHTFMYRGYEVYTEGNPMAHAILRGAVNSSGKNVPNYHYEDLVATIEAYEAKGLENQGIIVDTSHANANKQFERQPKIAMETIGNMNYDSKIRKYIKGLMIESYIVEGKQNIGDNVYGQSITDPCLGWEDSEKLIYEIAEKL